MNFTTGYLNTLTKYLPNEIRDYLQQENWVSFQDDIDKRVCMYYDDWKEEIKKHIKKKLSPESQNHFFPPGKDALWPTPRNINLQKRVVDEISLLYKNQAKRAFVVEAEEITDDMMNGQSDDPAEKKEEMDERFSEIADVEYNAMMQTVNKLVNVCNVVVVMVTPDICEEKGIRFDILTPDMFTPIQDPNNPQRLIGIIYCVDSSDTRGEYVDTRRELIYFMGNDEYEPFFAESLTGRTGQQEKPIEKQPYPYYYDGKPYLPFVTFRSDFPVAGEYVNRTQGDALYESTLDTAHLVSSYMRDVFDTSIKQLAATGTGAKELPPVIIRDTLSILRFPYDKDTAQLQMLDFQVMLKDKWESILAFVESTIAGYGLSIDKFKSTPQSGLSIRLSNQQLISRIEDQRPYFYAGERRLANVIRKINNSKLPAGKYGAIADNAVFGMDFGPLPFESDPYEMSDKYLAYVDRNIMSAPEIIQKLDPELTFEEACAKFERNKILNQKYRPAQTLNELAGGEEGIPPAIDEGTEKAEEVIEEEEV
jgi:hypothetical protein